MVMVWRLLDTAGRYYRTMFSSARLITIIQSNTGGFIHRSKTIKKSAPALAKSR